MITRRHKNLWPTQKNKKSRNAQTLNKIGSLQFITLYSRHTTHHKLILLYLFNT